MPIDPSIALNVRPVQQTDPMESMGRILALRNAMQMAPIQQEEARQKLHSEQLANQETELKRQDDQRTTQAWQQAQGDPKATIDAAVKLGVRPQAIQGLQKHFTDQAEAEAKLGDEDRKVRADKADRLMALTSQASQLPDDQYAASWPQIKAAAQAIDPKDKSLASLPDQPLSKDQLQHIQFGLVTHKAILDQADDIRKQKAAQQQTVAAADTHAAAAAKLPGEQADSDIKAASANALKSMRPEDWQTALDSTIPDKGSPLYARTAGAVKLALGRGDLKGAQTAIKDAGDQLGRTETAVSTAKATAPTKIEIAQATQQAGAAGATGNGLDLMAEQALNGSFSSRNPALMSKVYGRAAEIAQERGMNAQQVIMERNAAQANKTAFTSVTKQYETLKPFADMAERNANILEQKAKDISDLGAPILNMPLREIQSRFGGSTKVTAFVAALQPVQADFARILNSPTGGGVLSDNARHEMQQAISPGATPGQIKAALDVFRADAKNRKESYEAALSDLKGKTVVGGGGQAAQSGTAAPKNAPSLPATLSQSDVGKVYTSPKTGKPMKITAVNPSNPKQFRSEEVQQ